MDRSISKEALDLIGKFNESQNLEECKAHLERYLARHGVTHFAIAEFSGLVEPKMHVGKFPMEWVQMYRDQKYEYFDPVSLSVFKRDGRDIVWSELNKIAQKKSKGWRILNEGREFGLCDGLTFPLFGANGYLAGASFAAPLVDPDPEFRTALNLVATYAHARFLHLYRDQRTCPTDAELTPREREVLQWAAAGKSDWEIGEILCISEHTAQKHIENAKVKLGVGKRIQAVVEAMRRSLIRV